MEDRGIQPRDERLVGRSRAGNENDEVDEETSEKAEVDADAYNVILLQGRRQ